jgi:hypothetical protein
MSPQFWLYYDYASGDSNPGQGNTFGTFNQLFPFGYYYLGYSDLVARQNIQDLNMQMAAYPTDWIYVLLQYHKDDPLVIRLHRRAAALATAGASCRYTSFVRS